MGGSGDDDDAWGSLDDDSDDSNIADGTLGGDGIWAVLHAQNLEVVVKDLDAAAAADGEGAWLDAPQSVHWYNDHRKRNQEEDFPGTW